jgi:hypothetical protein
VKVCCLDCGRVAAPCYFRAIGARYICKSPSGCRRRREFARGLAGEHERVYLPFNPRRAHV